MAERLVFLDGLFDIPGADGFDCYFILCCFGNKYTSDEFVMISDVFPISKIRLLFFFEFDLYFFVLIFFMFVKEVVMLGLIFGNGKIGFDCFEVFYLDFFLCVVIEEHFDRLELY